MKHPTQEMSTHPMFGVGVKDSQAAEETEKMVYFLRLFQEVSGSFWQEPGR